MKQFPSAIWQFIKGNSSRFIWELVAVAISISVTWLISQFTGQQSLQACQDERAILLQEKTSAQSFADSIRWIAVLTEKNTTIKHRKTLKTKSSRLEVWAMKLVVGLYLAGKLKGIMP